MIKQSLPLRVLAISFIVLALPLIVDSFIFFQRAYFESIQDGKNELRAIGSLRAHELTSGFPVRPIVLSELAMLLDLPNEIPKLPSAKVNATLQDLSKISDSSSIFFITDAGNKGVYTVLASNHDALVNTHFKSYMDLPNIFTDGFGNFIRYFLAPGYSDIYEPFLFVGKAIYSKEKVPLGIILSAAQAGDFIQGILEGKVGRRGDLIRFALLNAEGIVFAATDQDLIGQTLFPISSTRREQINDSKILGEGVLAARPLPIIAQSGSPFFEFVFNDAVQIAYQSSVPTFSFSIISYSTKGAIFGRSIRHFLFVYSLYGLILLVGSSFTYWLSLWISRPLKQLSTLMGEVREGHFTVRFKPEPLGFELNLLGGIFNDTLDSLLALMQKAEDERVLKETYRREIDIGKEVQKNLLPQRMPALDSVEVAGTYLHAQRVGGDFYDILVKDPHHIVLTVADAAGQGISACLYSLGVRSLLRTYSTLYDDVGKICCDTNNLFLRDTGDSGMFVTVLTGIYDLEEKKLSYYSSGHVPGIVRRRDGRIEILNRAGMAMGLLEAKEYKADTVQLYSGDILLFFTDGLIDVENERGQHFSMRRLVNLLQQRSWTTAAQVIEGLTVEVQQFINNMPQGEEVIMLAMHVK